MKISSLIIMVFVITMFISGFTGFYSYMLGGVNGMTANDTRGFDNSTNISAVQRIISNMTEIVNNSQTSGVEAGAASTDAPYNLLTGAYNAAMQAFVLPTFFANMISELMFAPLGIPTWVSTGLVAIIGVFVIVGLVKFFAGRDF